MLSVTSTSSISSTQAFLWGGNSYTAFGSYVKLESNEEDSCGPPPCLILTEDTALGMRKSELALLIRLFPGDDTLPGPDFDLGPADDCSDLELEGRDDATDGVLGLAEPFDELVG